MKQLFFIIIFIVTTYSQNINKSELDFQGKAYKVDTYTKGNSSFISLLSFAQEANINYFANQDNSKIELKMSDYNFKFTARNQFVIIYDKKNDKNIIRQMPISTLVISDIIYIPKMLLSQIFIDYNIEETKIQNNEQIVENNKALTINKNASKLIKKIELDNKYNGTILYIDYLKKFNFSFQNETNSIKLNINTKDINIGEFNNIKPQGVIENIKIYEDENSYYVEFYFTSEFSKFEHSVDNETITMFFYNKAFQNKNNTNPKGRLDVIVIDPGHGGKDPGAIGVTGVQEKDINLKLALKLGELINKSMPDVKVVYTRNSDKFLELYKRGKIANENDGKLFISIHCNSMPKKPHPTSGFESYLLRPGRTDDAIKIAERENSVIKFEENPNRYQELTEENFILVSMAHSAYMRYSEKFADLLNQSLSKNTTLKSLGVKQAGFYVLVGASMPGILFEAGFLSNKTDEQYLNSNEGQNQIAKQMADAILEYRVFYENHNKN